MFSQSAETRRLEKNPDRSKKLLSWQLRVLFEVRQAGERITNYGDNFSDLKLDDGRQIDNVTALGQRQKQPTAATDDAMWRREQLVSNAAGQQVRLAGAARRSVGADRPARCRPSGRVRRLQRPPAEWLAGRSVSIDSGSSMACS